MKANHQKNPQRAHHQVDVGDFSNTYESKDFMSDPLHETINPVLARYDRAGNNSDYDILNDLHSCNTSVGEKPRNIGLLTHQILRYGVGDRAKM